MMVKLAESNRSGFWVLAVAVWSAGPFDLGSAKRLPNRMVIPGMCGKGCWGGIVLPTAGSAIVVLSKTELKIEIVILVMVLGPPVAKHCFIGGEASGGAQDLGRPASNRMVPTARRKVAFGCAEPEIRG